MFAISINPNKLFMKKMIALVSAFIIFSLVLNSCDKDKDDDFSVIGTWRVSGADYYYDGNLLSFHDTIIGIWYSDHRYDTKFMVIQGGMIFYEGDTGKLFGMGEYQTDENDFTYKKNQNKISITVQFPNSRTTNVDLEVRNDKLVVIQTNSDIYGWSPKKAENPSGTDGSCTHTLKIEAIYSR